MTPTGIEPVLPPWKGDVLTAWPRSLILLYHFFSFFQKKLRRTHKYIWVFNSPSRTWTYDSAVNSRVLYRLSYRGKHLSLHESCRRNFVSSSWKHPFLSKLYTFKTSYRLQTVSWSSLRPISNSQLHALLHFHLCPIYLVVFKGSYLLLGGDISSWGGLHA